MAFRVVGYRDLRPVDWASGKRLPLEAGAGHDCDRCGREHAVLYEILDEESGKHYVVGSGCAQKQFGFEVDKDQEAKQLVKSAKLSAELELDAFRHEQARIKAEEIVAEVSKLAVPEPTVEQRVGKPDVVRVGDSLAWIQFRSPEETVAVATEGWLKNRVDERIPPEWKTISVSQGSPAKTARNLRYTQSMADTVSIACCARLR